MIDIKCSVFKRQLVNTLHYSGSWTIKQQAAPVLEKRTQLTVALCPSRLAACRTPGVPSAAQLSSHICKEGNQQLFQALPGMNFARDHWQLQKHPSTGVVLLMLSVLCVLPLLLAKAAACPRQQGHLQLTLISLSAPPVAK